MCDKNADHFGENSYGILIESSPLLPGGCFACRTLTIGPTRQSSLQDAVRATSARDPKKWTITPCGDVQSMVLMSSCPSLGAGAGPATSRFFFEGSELLPEAFSFLIMVEDLRVN